MGARRSSHSGLLLLVLALGSGSLACEQEEVPADGGSRPDAPSPDVAKPDAGNPEAQAPSDTRPDGASDGAQDRVGASDLPAQTDGAVGPTICKPNDDRFCRVATREEGVSCPDSYAEAMQAFVCSRLPPASHWVTGSCGGYLIASWSLTWHGEDCVYGIGTGMLVGSRGYDACGAFCGGINRVMWGTEPMACGFGPDTVQEQCSSVDAGPFADGGESPEGDAPTFDASTGN